jgi:hypothetical protein
MMCEMRFLLIVLLCIVCSFWVTESNAQELTPRLFWPTPKGTRVLVSGYSYSTGDVFLDLSIPVEDAESRINTGILAYAQTLDLWGRTSNLLVNLPYAWGNANGDFLGDPLTRDFSGFGDFSMTLNVNLRGAPTMTVEEFQAYRANPRPIIGASLKVVMPTGQYNSDRVVNVSANRWATRLKLGAVIILKPKWVMELSASAWLFGDDDDFFAGKKEQDPIFALETNLIKRIRPGLWASLDLTYYRGGNQTISGAPLDSKLRNLKLGGTLVVPFLGRHAIKFGYANGVITRYGNDFNQFLVSYQVALK